MIQITITVDQTPETLAAIQSLLSNLPAPTGEKGPSQETKPAEFPKPKAQPKKKPEPPAEEPPKKIDFAELSAAAVKFPKEARAQWVKPLVGKYGAERLSAVAEEHYAALLADLQEAWEEYNNE